MSGPGPIGVFDSGIGGKSVADAIARAFPERQIIFINDPENLPYGSKTPEQMKVLVQPKLQSLVDQGCEVIVIACNTVTTNIIDWIRKTFTLPIIGIEPMVKPAAQLTESKVIAVCATPATLASNRYAWLKQEYAARIKVLEPDCSNWTKMIEADDVDRKEIQTKIDKVIEQGADVIVLGCTHYHWIEDLIKEIADDRAYVIQPEPAIISRVREVLD